MAIGEGVGGMLSLCLGRKLEEEGEEARRGTVVSGGRTEFKFEEVGVICRVGRERKESGVFLVRLDSDFRCPPFCFLWRREGGSATARGRGRHNKREGERDR